MPAAARGAAARDHKLQEKIAQEDIREKWSGRASRRPLSPAEIGTACGRSSATTSSTDEQYGHAVVTVTPTATSSWPGSCATSPEFDCDYFDFLTARRLRAEGQGFEVVIHLYSTDRNHNVRVKLDCRAEDAPPRDPRLWPGANWFEREAWEMFGIVFDGHPHLVKLVLPEPFEGHPLRKDFALMSPRGQAVAGRPRGRGGRGGVTPASACVTLGAVARELLQRRSQQLLGRRSSSRRSLVMVVFLSPPLAVGYMEHKVLAHMQARLGPMEAGGFHGWAQLDRRRREVRPEGGHRPERRRPLGVLAGAGRRADPVHRAVRRDPVRPHDLGREPRRRHLLRAGDVLGRR